MHALAERLGGMIDELPDLARASTGKLHIQRRKTDLRSIVSSAVESARMISRVSTINVDVPLQNVTLQGDTQRLDHAVLNLLANALKHAAQTRSIDVRLMLSEHEVILEVEDYSQGIAAEEIPHLLERYYQVRHINQDSACDHEGLGLGSYIAHQIVTAHGGRIDVASELGVGTRFTVTLPRI